MKTFRHAILYRRIAVVVTVTAGLVFVLVWVAVNLGIWSPYFAFAITWVPNGWMALVLPVIPVSLPERCRRIRPLERRLYERLAIRAAKKLLQSRFYVRLVPDFRRLARRNTLEELERKMRDAETAHLLVFVLILPFAVYAVWDGRYESAAWNLLFNLILNGFPVAVQRYNRGRLESILQRRKTGSSLRV